MNKTLNTSIRSLSHEEADIILDKVEADIAFSKANRFQWKKVDGKWVRL